MLRSVFYLWLYSFDESE